MAASLGVFVAASLGVPAHADTPEQWAETPGVSGFEVILVLFLLPAVLFGVITLLAALPAIIRGDLAEPGKGWHNESAWFGGPSKGVEALSAQPTQELAAGNAGNEKGGASARW